MSFQRPTSVTTLGVLSIVLGSLGLLGGCCGGSWLLIVFRGDTSYSSGSLIIRPYDDLWGYMQQQLPLFGPFLIGGTALGIIMSGVLLATGIGLLYTQQWARVTSIIWSIVSLVVLLGDIVFRVFFVMPALDRWLVDITARYGHFLFMNQTLTTAHGFMYFNQIVHAGCSGLVIVYAIILLVLLLLPGVGAAFSQRVQYEDVDDRDDRDRRRRPRRDRDWED